jgi:hypothetical protein
MSLEPGGYLLTTGDGPQLWFAGTWMNVKAGGAQTGGAFTLIEWSAPAGFGPPLHIRGREDEAFCILDGQISIQCGGKRALPPDPGLHVLAAASRTPTWSPAARYAARRSPRRPGLKNSSPRRAAAPPKGRACPAEPDIPLLAAAGRRYGHQILGPPPAPPASTAGGEKHPDLETADQPAMSWVAFVTARLTSKQGRHGQ